MDDPDSQKFPLKTLLLQIRDSDQVRVEEHASFARYSGLTPQQISILNVFDTPAFESQVLDDIDALFVGGASEASVLEPERFPFVESCIALLQACIARKLPVFASCFGFQLAVLALGGKIVRDEHDYEMGTPPISVMPAAADDPVFGGMPERFNAVSVHKERAPELPKSCILLAETASCPHAFRVKGAPFWAFQFHPELDRATLVERLTFYRNQYTDDDGQLQSVLDSAVETPHANQLLRNFVDRVLTK